MLYDAVRQDRLHSLSVCSSAVGMPVSRRQVCACFLALTATVVVAAERKNKSWPSDSDDRGNSTAVQVRRRGTDTETETAYCDQQHDGASNPCNADRSDFCCNFACTHCGPQGYCEDESPFQAHSGVCNPDFVGGICGNYFAACDEETPTPCPSSTEGFHDSFDTFEPCIWDRFCRISPSPCEIIYGSGMLQMLGGTNGLRTSRSFELTSILRIEGEVTKDAACSNHFLILSTSPSISYSLSPAAGTVKFVW